MLHRRLFWLIFAAVTWFAIGGTYVCTVGQPNQNSYVCATDHGVDSSNNEHEPAKTWSERLSIIWDRTWEDPVAFYTFILGLFTALLAIVSSFQIYFLKQADKTARITAEAAHLIGEAQVSAYVDIKTVSATFLDLGIGDVQPVIWIVAKNTGQSPARNFVWNIAIQFISFDEPQRRQEGEMGGNWRDIRGVGIPAQDELPDSAMATGMLLERFLMGGAAVLMRIRIEYEFDDVFKRRTVDNAYFSGVFYRKPNKIVTELGDTWWDGKLSRTNRPNDWPSQRKDN